MISLSWQYFCLDYQKIDFRKLCLGCFYLDGTNHSIITELSCDRVVTSQLKHNGLAIKGVCVPAGGGVAHFLQSRYNIL
jgi:hypothetical protein